MLMVWLRTGLTEVKWNPTHLHVGAPFDRSWKFQKAHYTKNWKFIRYYVFLLKQVETKITKHFNIANICEALYKFFLEFASLIGLIVFNWSSLCSKKIFINISAYYCHLPQKTSNIELPVNRYKIP
jgi:hypothetical protein